MDRPEVVVELGVGCGISTCMIAQALVDNGRGRLWAVDNGGDWGRSELRRRFQGALQYEDSTESYRSYLERLFRMHSLDTAVEYVEKTLQSSDFYSPPERIDALFSDAPPSDAEGCIDLLRYYLPQMQEYSSIFIDRASTINHSYLLLEYIVNQLNSGRIPRQLLGGVPKEDQRRIRILAEGSKFSLIHLTDSSPAKFNVKQNSRAWIRIEPNDYMPHNNVRSYF